MERTENEFVRMLKSVTPKELFIKATIAVIGTVVVFGLLSWYAHRVQAYGESHYSHPHKVIITHD